MPQSRRSSTTTALPWLSLRSRGLSVRLRSRTVKRLPPRPPRPRPLKRKRKRPLKRLPATDPREEQDFLYGHAFDVLLALGLVPSQDRLLQETGLSRMHVMEGEDKRVEMVAESAPDLPTTKPVTEIKLAKEVEDLSPTAEQEPKLAELLEPVVKSPSPASTPAESKDEVEESAAPEPLVNGELKEEKTDSESVVKVIREDICVENGKEDERTESEEKDSKEPVKEGIEVKEIGSGGCSEEEDRNSVTSSQSRKRGAGVEVEGEGSSSESDAGASKRPRLDPDDGEDERERLVREYVEEVTDSVEEMSRAADKLQREIGALGELLRAKELEWNSILRLRKLKEEMLERLLRRRRLASIMSGPSGGSLKDEPTSDHSQYKGGKPSNFNSVANSNHISHHSQNHNGLMMVPIVSSSPSPGHVTSSFSRGPGGPQPRQGPAMRPQRPILPKPPPDPLHGGPIAEGRQGAILDVKSIIADYRSRHPENVPRRGRRLRPHDGGGGGPLRPLLLEPQPPVVSSTRISGSPALMSMANMALGSGSHVRENPQAPTPSFMGQENSRPSSVDSSRGSHLDMLPAPGLSFKDALVQFAKMSQPPSLPSKPPPPPPPYPEVTLHPVSAPHSPPPHASLLHGILTKPPPGPTPPLPHPHRATTFSPTLARLLTAPERSPHNAQHSHASHTGHSHFRPPTSTAAQRVNICEILSSSKKNRNEITITPVSGSKNKDEVVLLGEEEEEGDGDRLVIDESRDNGGSGELPETVPECQGCHQRAAQFVCAGCGNQWYCSRECQVSAWEEHSEMCSG